MNQPQPVYAAPIQPNPVVVTSPNDQTQAVLVNQVQPVIIAPILPTKIGASPAYMNCPNCNANVTSNVEKKWSWGSCCLCCWTGVVIWLIIQVVREKDITCYDATHKCPNCGRVLGHFESC